MNANELADELEDLGKFFEDRLYTKAATMLRQLYERQLTLCELAGQYQTKLDAARAEIEALKTTMLEKEAFTQEWLLYATKFKMLMPTMCDSVFAGELGWSIEYLKGYNDAIREVRNSMKQASKPYEEVDIK